MRTVILSFARTPIGGLLSELSTLSATDLGAHSIRADVERTEIPEMAPDGVFMGCVLPAGSGTRSPSGSGCRTKPGYARDDCK